MHSDSQPLAFGLESATLESVNTVRATLGLAPLVATGSIDTSLDAPPAAEFIAFRGRGGGALAGWIKRNPFVEAEWLRDRKGRFLKFVGIPKPGEAPKPNWGTDEDGNEVANFQVAKAFDSVDSDNVAAYARPVQALNNQEQVVVEVGDSVRNLGRGAEPTAREIEQMQVGMPTDLQPGETRYVRLDPKQLEIVSDPMTKSGGKAQLPTNPAEADGLGTADDDEVFAKTEDDLDPEEVLPLINELNIEAAEIDSDNPEAAQALRDAAAKLDEAADADTRDGQDEAIVAAQEILEANRAVDDVSPTSQDRIAELADRVGELVSYESAPEPRAVIEIPEARATIPGEGEPEGEPAALETAELEADVKRVMDELDKYSDPNTPEFDANLAQHRAILSENLRGVGDEDNLKRNLELAREDLARKQGEAPTLTPEPPSEPVAASDVPDAATAASEAIDIVEASDVADVPEVQAAVDAIDDVVGPEGVRPEATSHDLSDAANAVDDGAIAAADAGDEETAGALDDAADAIEAEADQVAEAEAGTPDAPERVPLSDPELAARATYDVPFENIDAAGPKANEAYQRATQAGIAYTDALEAGDEEAAARALADSQQALSDWAAEMDAAGNDADARRIRARSRRIGTALRKAGYPRSRIDRRNQPKAIERRRLAAERKAERDARRDAKLRAKGWTRQISADRRELARQRRARERRGEPEPTAEPSAEDVGAPRPGEPSEPIGELPTREEAGGEPGVEPEAAPGAPPLERIRSARGGEGEPASPESSTQEPTRETVVQAARDGGLDESTAGHVATAVSEADAAEAVRNDPAVNVALTANEEGQDSDPAALDAYAQAMSLADAGDEPDLAPTATPEEIQASGDRADLASGLRSQPYADQLAGINELVGGARPTVQNLWARTQDALGDPEESLGSTRANRRRANKLLWFKKEMVSEANGAFNSEDRARYVELEARADALLNRYLDDYPDVQLQDYVRGQVSDVEARVAAGEAILNTPEGDPNGWWYMDDYVDEVDYTPMATELRDLVSALHGEANSDRFETKQAVQAAINVALRDLNRMVNGNLGATLDPDRETRFERVINRLNRAASLSADDQELARIRDGLLDIRRRGHGISENDTAWDLDDATIEAAIPALIRYMGHGSESGIALGFAKKALGDALNAPAGSTKRWAALMRARNEIDLVHANELTGLMNALRVRVNPDRLRDMDDPTFRLAEENLAPSRPTARGGSWSPESLAVIDTEIAAQRAIAGELVEGQEFDARSKAASSFRMARQAYDRGRFGEFEAFYSLGLSRLSQAGDEDALRRMMATRDAHWGEEDWAASAARTRSEIANIMGGLPTSTAVAPRDPAKATAMRHRQNARAGLAAALRLRDGSVEQRIAFDLALWRLRQAGDSRDLELRNALSVWDPNGDVRDAVPNRRDPNDGAPGLPPSAPADARIARAQQFVNAVREYGGITPDFVATHGPMSSERAEALFDELVNAGVLTSADMGDGIDRYVFAPEMERLTDAELANRVLQGLISSEGRSQRRPLRRPSQASPTQTPVPPTPEPETPVPPTPEPETPVPPTPEPETPEPETGTGPEVDAARKIDDLAQSVLSSTGDSEAAEIVQSAAASMRDGDKEGARSDLERASFVLLNNAGLREDGEGYDPARTADVNNSYLALRTAATELEIAQPADMSVPIAHLENLLNAAPAELRDTLQGLIQQLRDGDIEGAKSALDNYTMSQSRGSRERDAAVEVLQQIRMAETRRPGSRGQGGANRQRADQFLNDAIAADPENREVLSQIQALAAEGDLVGAQSALRTHMIDQRERGEVIPNSVAQANSELVQGLQVGGHADHLATAIDVFDPVMGARYRRAANNVDGLPEQDALDAKREVNGRVASMLEARTVDPSLSRTERRAAAQVLSAVRDAIELHDARMAQLRAVMDENGDMVRRPLPGQSDTAYDYNGLGIVVGDTIQDAYSHVMGVVEAVNGRRLTVRDLRTGQTSVVTDTRYGTNILHESPLAANVARHFGSSGVGAQFNDADIAGLRDRHGPAEAAAISAIGREAPSIANISDASAPDAVREQALVDVLSHTDFGGIQSIDNITLTPTGGEITVTLSPSGTGEDGGAYTLRVDRQSNGLTTVSVDIDSSRARGARTRQQAALRATERYAIANGATSLRQANTSAGSRYTAANSGFDWDTVAMGGLDATKVTINQMLARAARDSEGDAATQSIIADMVEEVESATDINGLPTPYEIGALTSADKPNLGRSALGSRQWVPVRELNSPSVMAARKQIIEERKLEALIGQFEPGAHDWETAYSAPRLDDMTSANSSRLLRGVVEAVSISEKPGAPALALTVAHSRIDGRRGNVSFTLQEFVGDGHKPAPLGDTGYFIKSHQALSRAQANLVEFPSSRRYRPLSIDDARSALRGTIVDADGNAVDVDEFMTATGSDIKNINDALGAARSEYAKRGIAETHDTGLRTNDGPLQVTGPQVLTASQKLMREPDNATTDEVTSALQAANIDDAVISSLLNSATPREVARKFEELRGDVLSRMVSAGSGSVNINGDWIDASLMVVNDDVQNTGLAGQMVRQVADWGTLNDIKRFHVHANISIGSYAWAPAGFNWANDPRGQARSVLAAIQSKLKTDKDRADFAAITNRVENTPVDAEDFPTPFELSQIGFDPEREGMWAGKEGMFYLHWYGNKHLRRDRSYTMMIQYYKDKAERDRRRRLRARQAASGGGPATPGAPGAPVIPAEVPPLPDGEVPAAPAGAPAGGVV